MHGATYCHPPNARHSSLPRCGVVVGVVVAVVVAVVVLVEVGVVVAVLVPVVVAVVVGVVRSHATKVPSRYSCGNTHRRGGREQNKKHRQSPHHHPTPCFNTQARSSVGEHTFMQLCITQSVEHGGDVLTAPTSSSQKSARATDEQ